MSEPNASNPEREDDVPNDSARGAIVTGLVAVVTFFVGLGGWAAYAPLAGAVVAPAVITVDGNRKTIQHLDGGIVKKLLVRDGSRVEVGQTLIVLDDTQAQASLDVLRQQNDQLRALEGRLLAERDGEPSVGFPPELTARQAEPDVRKLVATETRQFEIRRTSLDGQISVLRQKIEGMHEQIRGAEAQLAATNESIGLMSLELDDQHMLLRKGLTPRSKVLELERVASNLRGQKGEISGTIARVRQAIGETELQIIQARNDRRTEVARDLREAQAKIADVVPRLRAAEDVLDRTNVRSPYAGYVVDLGVFSVGAVIQRGDKIMDVVPSTNDLIAEASINVDDIDDVHPRMRAEMRFTAYKQRIMPIIHGDVINVSADRLADKRTGAPYYTAQIRVDDAELAASKNVTLYPGMAVTVMIQTRARTALDYLISPVIESFDRSFRQK